MVHLGFKVFNVTDQERKKSESYFTPSTNQMFRAETKSAFSCFIEMQNFKPFKTNLIL